MWAQAKIARWRHVKGNVVLAIICTLFMGGAVTVLLAVNFWNGAYYDAWLGLGYIIFIGIAAGGFTYVGVMLN